jgi:hypothetical protein
MQSQPHVFVYLDTNGIESLFAQTVDRIETEIRTSLEEGRDNKVGGKLGLGKAIAVLLGIELGASLETSKASKKLEEAKLSLATEHKLARLQQYLRESNNLDKNLSDAIKRANQVKKSVFIDVEDLFDMPQFARGGGGVEKVNRDGAILCEVVDRFSPAKIVMVASLSKFPRLGGGRLNRLSHDAINFASYGGKDVRLHIFGSMLSLGTGTFQVKPYAIWL